MGSIHEEWRPVAGEYEGWPYEISNLGRVVDTRKRHRFLRPSKCGHKKKYLIVSLTNGERRKFAGISRLIAMAFIPGYEPGLEVNHKNGVTADNRIENLEWVTPLQNVRHAIETGLHHGGRHLRRLTDQQARAVIALSHRGVDKSFLSRWFGVNATAIRLIAERKTYLDV